MVKYTHRQLTHQHDRLNAISGIANKFGSTLFRGCIYKAGLWQEAAGDQLEFIRSLMWRRDDDVTPVSEYRKHDDAQWPSWSWASIEGPISYADRTQDEFEISSQSDFIACNIDLESPHDVYGPIRRGSLVVSGPVKEISWQPEHQYQSDEL